MTKKEISDSVLFKLAGGYPDGSFEIDERQIFSSIEHKVNSMLKGQQFSINLPSGGTIPENLMLATYENIAVTRTSNERSKCTLPVMPISLPRNAGINEIRPVLNLTDSGDKMLGNPLIPLQAGQSFLLQADTLLNDLMGQWSYEVNGKTIIISKDLTVFSITKVDIKLVVFEISQYSITQDLPIPSDWVDMIEDELIKEFAPVTPESGYVNPWSGAGQAAPKNVSQ
jgi:hypothetical protein